MLIDRGTSPPAARPFLALVLIGGALAAAGCGPAAEGTANARPTLRFECAEGCGSYKTVDSGETPPPCCGVAMERAETAARPTPATGTQD